jgi:hypothetical protein
MGTGADGLVGSGNCQGFDPDSPVELCFKAENAYS